MRITIEFRGTSYVREFPAYDVMQHHLFEFAYSIGVESSHYFSVIKSSGVISPRAGIWGMDRTDSFAAAGTRGSWEKNGFRDGDQTRMHRLYFNLEREVHLRHGD